LATASRPITSGRPYVQPAATRCAVEASITRVVSLAIIATAARAASSGRHRITTSALIASARAPSSLRRASRVISENSPRPASRSAISVPTAPSMKTRVVMPPSPARPARAHRARHTRPDRLLVRRAQLAPGPGPRDVEHGKQRAARQIGQNLAIGAAALSKAVAAFTRCSIGTA
jgi:hypothetical protein